ncbi:MAG TPA: cytochrome c family protein [Polyangiaceae bacterium]
MPTPAVPRLHRRRRFLERHWPWFLFALFTGGCATTWAVAIDQSVFAIIEGFEPILRGYTLTGLAYGLGSLFFCLLAFLYAFRKRSLQERMPLGRATLATWLWAHVYLGLLALVLALAHAGYGALSSQLSTGKLLLFVLAGLVVGGLVWRILYVLVPPSVAREVGNYSLAASRARAEACRVEIDKISAGSSPRFRELTAWVLARTPYPAELDQAVGSLPAEERAGFVELAALAKSRLDALERERKQARYLRLLQGLRIAHVPLGLLFLVLVPIHVIFAYDAPARLLVPGIVGGSSLGGFEPSASCKSCHEDIYEAWSHSMHAHAMTSPLMIAQTNQVAARVLNGAEGPDPKEVCVSCHGPIGTLLTVGNTLPLPADVLSDRALLDDGIGCAVCHQWQGQPSTGGAGLSKFLAGLEPGRTYYGPYDDAVGNAFHRSEKGAIFSKPEQLCRNCHNVQLDKNADGKFDRGVDLVLQTLFDEWELYSKNGGGSCLDCHMPVVRKAKRAAEAALIPFEQDREAPDRVLRDHSFVAVDYPLDNAKARDRTRKKREALLRSAGTFAIVEGSVKRAPDSLAFDVTLTNNGTGHNLPGGFAFVRQMWVEITIEDASGKVIASSGKLENPSDDLCDASIVDSPESPMRPFLSGCKSSDTRLLNFQQMLVDKVEIARDEGGAAKLGARGENLLQAAEGARECVIQYITSGPVPRKRPSSGKPTVPLIPGETGTYPYAFPLAADAAPKRLTARLLFRVASPYFLRALGKDQPPAEKPRVEALVPELEITEMAKVSVDL